MEFNVPNLIAGFVFSGVGFVYFSFARKQTKPPILICGLLLMIYPYFVDKLWVSIVVGMVLSGLPFVMRWW
jgi:hypothetical protein